LPVVMYSSSLKGLLEAAQRFDLVNAVRIPSSSLAFLLPAVAVFLGFQLPGTVLFLIISMIVTGSAYLLFCFKVFPSLRQPYSPNLTIIRPLFTYGGWITVCSIIIPFLIYSDRFLIGALVSVAAVGYYTAPYEMASRLQIFPWSFATTLFPAFSAMAAFQAKEISLLYARSLKYLLLVMAPITLFIVLFAQVILHLWLGSDFSEKGTLVFQILSVGMLLNALSQIPANLLDGMGRPDLRAKLFILYGAVYLVLAWFLISTMGIVGAALAWALRGGLELLLFFLASWRLLRFDPAIFIENGLLKGLIVIAFLSGIIPTIITTLGKGVWVQGAVTAICFMLFGVVIWIYVLDQIDKSGLKAIFPRLTENRKTVQ
jgi:O-antigen/teichoic acid export membrane protein